MDDPARAAVELVNSMKEQETGQFEVQVAIGAVFYDELYFTLKALIPILESEENPLAYMMVVKK